MAGLGIACPMMIIYDQPRQQLLMTKYVCLYVRLFINLNCCWRDDWQTDRYWGGVFRMNGMVGWLVAWLDDERIDGWMDGRTDGCLLYGSVRVCTFVQITVCLCVWLSVRFEMIARPMGVSVSIRYTTWFPVAAAVVGFIFSFFSVLQMIPSLFLVDVCFCCYCFIFVDIQYGDTLVLGRSLYSSNSLLLRLPRYSLFESN